MKKSKAICFDYLRTYIQRYDGETNTVIEELGDLEECLQRISKMDSVDRTLRMGNDKVRIQELKKYDGLWEFLILKLRDEIMPGIADDNGNYTLEILEDGKYYCESTTMIYDPEKCIVVMQKNRFGLQASNLELLFNKINIDEKIGIILKPIINKNKINLLDKDKVYRSLEIGFANSFNEENIQEKTNGILGTLNNFQKYKGNSVTIRIGYDKRAKKDDCLDSNLVVDTINQLYGNIEINKLKTSIKFDDDTKAETIDLLDDRIYDRENFEYNKENPITHERIVNTLRLLYKNKKKNLIK